MRICSGRFQRDKEYYHVQGGKTLRLAQPQQLMAQERAIIDAVSYTHLDVYKRQVMLDDGNLVLSQCAGLV